jgi:hypothetical protein
MLWMVLAVIGLLLIGSFFSSRSKVSVQRVRRRARGYVGVTPPISGDGVSDCGAGDAGCDGGGAGD